jgi:hypothetical protein
MIIVARYAFSVGAKLPITVPWADVAGDNVTSCAVTATGVATIVTETGRAPVTADNTTAFWFSNDGTPGLATVSLVPTSANGLIDPCAVVLNFQ